MEKITLIKSLSPDRVCKTYDMVGGRLEKRAIANISQGIGVTVPCESAEQFAKILTGVTDRTDLAICAGVWHNSIDNQKFKIVPEAELAELAGSSIGKVGGGVLDLGGELVSARLKRGIDNSCWVLLDADNPVGMPDEWCSMNIQRRLEMWDKFIPDISKCERVELCGSSARVVDKFDIGSREKNATHAWIRVSHPEKISVLKAHIRVNMVLSGASFSFKKISKIDGTQVGCEDRSVFDLAVFDTGRLVFCARPELSESCQKLYDVTGANVSVINAGGGALDIGWLELPSPASVEELRASTGIKLAFTSSGSGSLHTVVSGELSLDTPVEVRGVTKELRQWASTMSVGEKLRCESPFRVSSSESAFIRINDSGSPFIYDIGNGCTYKLSGEINFAPAHQDMAVSTKDVVGGGDAEEFTSVASAQVTSECKQAQNTSEIRFNDWVYLTSRALFYNKITGEELTHQAFNTAFSRDVPEIESDDGNGLKTISPVKYVMNHLEAHRPYDTLYMPSMTKMEGDDGIFVYENVTYVNAYRPHLTPSARDGFAGSEYARTCEAHVRQILPEDADVLIQWLAFNVQRTGEKVLWAPIIKGIQGDGKTTIGRMLGAAIGHSNLRVIATEEMQSDFNGYAEGFAVAILEEIRVLGHNRHDSMNKLKPLVTNDKISVVKKGSNGRQIPNVTNYAAFTNHEDALVLENDDRRWGVFFTKYTEREQMVSETGREYWERLNYAIDHHASDIRAWLMSIDLSQFNERDAPAHNAAKTGMINQSKTDDERDILDAIEIGGYGVCQDVLSTVCLNDVISKMFGHKKNGKRLSKALDKVGMVKVSGVMKWKNRSHRIYVSQKYGGQFAGNDDESNRSEMRDMLDATVQLDDDFVTSISSKYGGANWRS